MAKYTALRRYLNMRYDNQVTLTFAEIEQIIGAPLPPKAQRHRAWWSNNPENNVMTREWLAAGFRTEQVDIERGSLVFRRETHTTPTRMLAEPTAVWETRTMDKTTQHPLIGAMKGLIAVTGGADLTAPADPEWADASGR
jgi:hypothetical protein